MAERTPHGTKTGSNIYVNGTTGSDTTGDGSQSKPFKTITKALNSLPRFIYFDQTIICAPGVYNEKLIINGFLGSGYIQIITSVLGSKVTVTDVNITDCDAFINLTEIECTSPNTSSITVTSCKYVVVDNCKLDAVSNGYGVYAQRNSLIYITKTNISNKVQAISSEFLSSIFSDNNLGNGNSYALKANSGSSINKSGAQPSGTTQEYTDTGGVIR